MFSRLLVIGVVFFWLLMNGALLRLWIDPGTSEVLTIPVEHVVKQVFLHEQTSNLAIYQGGRPAGSLTLQPRRFDAKGLFVVDFTGNLLLQLPFLSQQPFSWHGTVEMNQKFELKQVKIHVDARVPQLVTDIAFDAVARVAVCRLQYDGSEPVETTVPLDETGLKSLMEGLGFDANVLAQLTASVNNVAEPGSEYLFSARQSQIQIHGERVQAFHINFRQSNTPMVELDISQLGQILSVKTAFGFTLSPQD